jgi:hypothetical protein
MAKTAKPTLGTITVEYRTPVARRAVAPGTLEILGADAEAMLNDLRVEGLEAGPVCVIPTKWGLCLESRLTGGLGCSGSPQEEGMETQVRKDNFPCGQSQFSLWAHLWWVRPFFVPFPWA